MNILVLNCGSSSVKFKLIDARQERDIASGVVEKVGTDEAIYGYQPEGQKKMKSIRVIPNHETAISMILDSLTDQEHGVIKDASEIDAVGHRVVHGAEEFFSSTMITEQVKTQIDLCSAIAPLHNPANLAGIEVTEKLIPGVPMVAVFDTAFHHTMPKKAYLYGLPMEMYRKHGIRKYGFHGTSHAYVAMKTAEILDRPIEELKIITVHLGNGASIAAVDCGKSVDTSMGYTPLEGLIMGTRCGDMDPALVPIIMQREQLDIVGINNMMNKQSGLKGLSGVSNDCRDIHEAIAAGNEDANTAIDAFAYRVKKYVGSYIAAMNGVDAIVFTAGIGERDEVIRERAMMNMEWFGIEFDQEANLRHEQNLSTGKVKVMIVPTNEELAITRETVRIIDESRKKR
jgi:acetate kinase